MKRTKISLLCFVGLLAASFLGFLPVSVLGAKTITYNPTTNLITCTGGTEGDPITFNDLYNADKGGQLTLEPYYNFSNEFTTFYLDTQPKPCNWGGIQLFVDVASYQDAPNSTVDTLKISGTDSDPESTIIYSDTIGIGSTGEKPSDYSFGSVTYCYIEITGWANLSIFQKRWGAVWKTGDNQFMFDCRIVIGDGSTTTWFTDTDKEILFSSTSLSGTYQNHLEVTNFATLTMGKLDSESEKRTSKGVSVVSDSSYTGTRIIRGISGGSRIYLYSSSLAFISATGVHTLGNYGSGKIYNCRFQNLYVWRGSWTIYNLDIYGDDYGVGNLGVSTIEKLTVYDTTYRALYFYTGTSVTITDLKARNNVMLALCREITVDSYLINADVDNWNFQWYLTSSGEVYRQYTFDLLVTYPNGTGINGTATGARVVIQHYGQGGSVDYNQTLGEDGTITQQTLSRSFYNQTGGDSEYSYNPFNLYIYNVTGYDTYSKNYTLSAKTDWTIALTPTAANVIPIWGLVLGGGLIAVVIIILLYVWRR